MIMTAMTRLSGCVTRDKNRQRGAKSTQENGQFVCEDAKIDAMLEKEAGYEKILNDATHRVGAHEDPGLRASNTFHGRTTSGKIFFFWVLFYILQISCRSTLYVT